MKGAFTSMSGSSGFTRAKTTSKEKGLTVHKQNPGNFYYKCPKHTVLICLS